MKPKRVILRLALWAILLVFVACSAACSATPKPTLAPSSQTGLLTTRSAQATAEATSETAATVQRHPLWRVAPRPGLSGTGYLLGSIHLGRERDQPLPEVIENAFAAAEVVVFEIDLDQAMSDSMALLQDAFFQDERTLQNEVSEETWALLVERADSLPLPLPMLAKAKPWFVAMALSIGDLESGGFSVEAGVDLVLTQRAREEDKERVALETAAEQLAFFNSFSREEQEMFLRQALEEAEEGATQSAELADEIVAAWEAGDIEALEELFHESMAEFPALAEKLLDERNRRWLPKVEELLAEHDTVLVVVGAAHLVGEGSLVELLESAGYSVRQSTSEP